MQHKYTHIHRDLYKINSSTKPWGINEVATTNFQVEK